MTERQPPSHEADDKHGQGAWLSWAEISSMVPNDQDALVLLAYLRAEYGLLVSFAVPRRGPALGWDSKRLDRATARLVELGHLERSPSAPKEHGAYRWPDRTAT